MNKAAAIAIAALMSVASFSTDARAGDGGALAAGVIGGLAFGALAGAAIAHPHRPAYVYEDYGYVPTYRYRRVYHDYRPHYDYPSYGYRYGYGGYGSWYDY